MDGTCSIAHCAASCSGSGSSCSSTARAGTGTVVRRCRPGWKPPGAVGGGLGVALMATLGQTPEMLVVRHDLPRPEPIPLTVRHRPGLAGEIPRRAAAALRRLLATAVTTTNLAKGA